MRNIILGPLSEYSTSYTILFHVQPPGRRVGEKHVIPSNSCG